MAYELIWSPRSRDDLRDIVCFISRDSALVAQGFAIRLMSHADILQDQPEIGRVVPELRIWHIREIIFRPYRVDHSQELSRFHGSGMQREVLRRFQRPNHALQLTASRPYYPASR